MSKREYQTGISRPTIMKRLAQGWSEERTLSTQTQPNHRRNTMKYTLPEIQSVIAMGGQFKRLYISCKCNERFTIQVLPEGEKAKLNGINPCTNEKAVTVFNWQSNQSQLFENSWLFEGKWQEDFNNLVEDLINTAKVREQEQAARKRTKAEAEKQAQLNLLATYK